MLSFFLRSPGAPGLRAVLLGLMIAGAVAVPATASADAALDLVRNIAATTPCQAIAAAPKARTRPPARASRAGRPALRARAARPARLQLTAAQRGSGRVDVVVLANDREPSSSLPSVERKIDRVRPTSGRR
jgi:hypothetical protein